MGQAIHGRDMSEAEFWGVDLRKATFRDVHFGGVRISHAWLVDVEIDGLVDGLTVNGVDVTDFVNARDPWQPLRSMVAAADVEAMRAAQVAFDEAWSAAIRRARAIPGDAVRTSVDDEWSLLDTLRHLVFVLDKWCTVPLLGATEFHPLGRPNTGSADRDWPGLDRDAEPDLDTVVAALGDRSSQFRAYLAGIGDDDLGGSVEVIENGTEPVTNCIGTVFEEQFEHLRYATRDLDVLERR